MLFFEDIHSEKRERLFMEFNSLSVVYGRPSEKFLKDKALRQQLALEKKHYPKDRGFQNADTDKLLENETKEEAPIVNDLLDFGSEQPAATEQPA